MAYAGTLRGIRVATPTRTSPVAPRWGVFRAMAGAIVDSRRRRALREIRRHQAFGPLMAIRHVGLTRDELLPF